MIQDEKLFVSLGFAEKPMKGDLTQENFPSKIGGLPIWLLPPLDIDIDYFTCSSCKNKLYFLMQIYCPLEENKNAYHRVLYIFFCAQCWKKFNSIKVLRIQLPEISDYYKRNKLLIKDLEKNEAITKINNCLNFLNDEYIIESFDEKSSATRIYMNFYDKIEEKSIDSKNSKKNIEIEEDIDEDELIPSNTNINDDKVESMLDEYYKEEKEYKKNKKEKDRDYGDLEDDLENEMMTKLQKDIFKTVDDIFYDLFCKIVEYDPEQILRYCRDEVNPLWFNSNAMLSIQNTKCKHCKGDMIYECQVMPNIFNIFQEIMNTDIGVIIIYTCKNSCLGKEKLHMEEYGYIQRTGEKLIEFGESKGNSDKLNIEMNNMKISSKNEPDEEGFVEVKKRKKKD